MKSSIISILLFQLIHFSLFAQDGPRLIVRGDDMGYSHSGNEALIKCYKEGIETTIEVIVPSPWFPEAVKLLKENPGVDVGIHLALTSEWDNIKWRPLSNCTSLKDANGYFYPMIWPNKNYPGQSVTENRWNLADIEMEFRAQIEMAIKLIPQVSHLSAHMGCTGISEDVKKLTQRLAAEYHISDEPDYHVYPLTFGFGNAKTSEARIAVFLDFLSKLQNGKTYVFLDHPGLNNEELKAVHHIGYEDVATDRQGVTDVFTHDRVKALIRKRGIQLIGYKDLVKN